MSWFKLSKTRTSNRRPSGRLDLQRLDERINPSHFRYANFTWEPHAAPSTEIHFSFQQAWRRSFYSPIPNVGSIVSTGTVNFGDATSAAMSVRVLSIDVPSDSFVGEWVESDGKGGFNSGFHHTYAKAGTFTAFHESCCRISTSKNNPDGNYRIESIVNAGTGNNPPVSSLPPIVQVQDNTIASFQVPGFDEDSDPLNYRLSTSAEAGNPFTQPNGLTISKSGVVTWDIRDATLPAVAIGQLWSSQLMIEDLTGPGGAVKSRIAVDFLLQVVANTNSAPIVTAVPAGPFAPVAGQTLNFTVNATDNDAGNTISSFQLLNPPVGMTATGFVPGTNPGTLNVSWTPTQAQANATYVLTFQAQDNSGATGFGSVTISPTANSAPTVVADDFNGTEDMQLADNVLSNDSDPEGNPFTAAVATLPSNGVLNFNPDGSFTFDPVANFSGDVTFTYTASDSFGTSTPATVTMHIAADADAPTLGTGGTGGSEGSPIALPITAALIDLDGSESLSIGITGVPAGATLNQGVPLGGGAYKLTPADLLGLTITVPDNMTFNLGVTATSTEASNSDSATSTGSVVVTVFDVAPVVTVGGNASIGTGALFTRGGFFVDPGADSVWTATVNYGTGGGNVPLTLNPDKSFNLSNTYTTAGTYTVTVIVSDKDGISGSATFQVVVNNGAGVDITIIGDALCPDQRSMVRKLSITFVTQVNIAPGAFSVIRQNGTPYTFNTTTALVAGKTVATLTFTGPGLIGGSLPDANYTLNVNGAMITSATSTPISGGNFSLAFHRYFGDINGDRRVNDLDLAVLNPVLRSRINQVQYTQACGGFYFDYDTNGFVDPTADYNQFLARYKTRLNENGTISIIRAAGG